MRPCRHASGAHRIGHAMACRSDTRRIVFRIALAGLLCGAACQSHAQFVVHDPGHVAANAASWAKQWLQWKQQFDHWKQQYFTMLNVVQASPAFFDTTQLKRRGPYDGVAQRCPEPGWLAGKIARQQHVFCRMLLQVDNSRYNVLVELNRQITRRNEEMQAILARRIVQALSSDLGALKAFDSEMQTFQANVEHDMNNAKAALDQYASLGEAIKEQQARLTEQALRSAPSGSGAGLVGGLVQGATLKGALEAAKHW